MAGLSSHFKLKQRIVTMYSLIEYTFNITQCLCNHTVISLHLHFHNCVPQLPEKKS